MCATKRFVCCVLLLSLLLAACASAPDRSASGTESTGVETESNINYSGAESFTNRCAVCHGDAADGTDNGPPLVHRLYEIGHHGDHAFRNAVNNGVTAHHWTFGDMPPIPNVHEEEINAIICHVRDLQRAEGITAGEPC